MIRVRDLVRTFGTHRALDGLDLTVAEGTVHAVLGPNGAGKTTAVRILTTLLRPTAGLAEVAGHDVGRAPDEVRRRIGLVGQHAALDEGLSGRQNLELFGRLHHLGGPGAARRAAGLLAEFSLEDTGDRPVRTYSGGMRRRLDLAASLITHPKVLFLDEPTTGLDPRGRAEVWQAVRRLTGAGTTVLLTTQYLEEADQLAHRISVIDRGRCIADGTADSLKTRAGADRIDIVVRDPAQLDRAAAVVGGTVTDADRRLVSRAAPDRLAALTATVTALTAADVEAQDVALRRPTLDEVFLTLTGNGAGPAAPADRPGPTDSDSASDTETETPA